MIVRIVELLEGSVSMCSDLSIRFDYGRIVPWVRRRTGGIEAIAGPDRVRLHTTAPLGVPADTRPHSPRKRASITKVGTGVLS